MVSVGVSIDSLSSSTNWRRRKWLWPGLPGISEASLISSISLRVVSVYMLDWVDRFFSRAWKLFETAVGQGKEEWWTESGNSDLSLLCHFGDHMVSAGYTFSFKCPLYNGICVRSRSRETGHFRTGLAPYSSDHAHQWPMCRSLLLKGVWTGNKKQPSQTPVNFVIRSHRSNLES